MASHLRGASVVITSLQKCSVTYAREVNRFSEMSIINCYKIA